MSFNHALVYEIILHARDYSQRAFFMNSDHNKYYFFEQDAWLSAVARAEPRMARRVISRGPRNFYPIALYKYRSLASDVDMSRLRALVIDSEFYLSSRAQLNDPFDANAVPFVTEDGPARIRWARNLAKGQKVPYKDRKRFLSQMSSPAFARQRALLALNSTLDGSGLFSFAGDPRDILMWSHYSGSHTGICLRFEISRDPGTFLHALPVRYTERFPVIDWMTTSYADRTIAALLTKSPHWQYERERRIVVENGAGKFIQFQPGALTHVIYGCKTSAASIAQVRSLLAERVQAGKPPVKELYAHRSPERFSLGIFGSAAAPREWSGRATWPPPRTEPPQG